MCNCFGYLWYEKDDIVQCVFLLFYDKIVSRKKVRECILFIEMLTIT